MNTLKQFIAIAFVNAVLMIGVISWGPLVKQAVFRNSFLVKTVTPIPTPATEISSPTPTKIPKRRVVRVVRKAQVAGQVTSGSVPAPAVTTTVTSSGGSAVAPTSAPPTTAPPPSPVDNRCLIQIDGVAYDITAFRSAHSGGNVFTCGADMSQVFWSKHGKSLLDYMARFRV